MRETNVKIENCESNFGENCQLTIEFDTVQNLYEIIREIQSEVEYDFAHICVEFDDIELTDEDIEYLKGRGVEF
jgi:hypothetical protein